MANYELVKATGRNIEFTDKEIRLESILIEKYKVLEREALLPLAGDAQTIAKSRKSTEFLPSNRVN